jgi:hypothetical protein
LLPPERRAELARRLAAMRDCVGVTCLQGDQGYG